MDLFSKERLSSPIVDFATTDVLQLSRHATVLQVMQALRGKGHDNGGATGIFYLYVIDEGKLHGVVPVRRLLTAPLDTMIDHIAIHDVITIQHDATLGQACEEMVQRRLLALPVVDQENNFLGVVDMSQFTEEIKNISQHHESENMFQLVGFSLPDKETSLLDSFHRRFPWLLCNVASGIACAVISAFYEPLLERAIVMALFMTVVLALAESVSMQSMSLALAQLHRSEKAPLIRTIFKECANTLLLGAGCATVMALTVWFWRNDLAATITISGAVWGSIISAGFLGVAYPLVLHRLKINPRIASGPIALASADMCTLIIYYNLGSLMFR